MNLESVLVTFHKVKKIYRSLHKHVHVRFEGEGSTEKNPFCEV